MFVASHGRLAFALIAVYFAWAAQLSAAPRDREKYAPDPGAGYPQILQRHDYATIACIEMLYDRLAPLAHSDDALRTKLMCEVSPKALTFRSRDGQAVTLTLEGEDAVMLGRKRFTAAPTITWCQTLLRVVTDLASDKTSVEVCMTRFATRAYRKRTVIGFDFGPRVVEVDCLANGPGNEERLYVLDIEDRDDSFLWYRADSRSTTR